MSGDPYIKENDELRNSLGEALVRENNLIAENAKLKEGVKQAEIVCDSYATENQQFSDTIDKLRAALESARTGLLGCLVYLDRRKSHPEAVFCDGTEILINNIDSALANEQKP